eukprot:CAMPEP_0179314300 /NCGR_PEP_ID=MMETSP0797-20121207/54355_1 /TAXON_ID=47934 /ORGANISM="Dinophysis acuminata, Strain DAEP01" /LENGTH=31 /DNA_ID= /DNA_START= /DNA_END= /DNA_ORIENTATION=
MAATDGSPYSILVAAARRRVMKTLRGHAIQG